VRADESLLPLTAAKQKSILALLLLHRGEVVSVDRLQEGLWGERPPATAPTALQGYVSQLRRLLETGEEGGGSLLVTRSPGYLLAAAPDQLDLTRFERLTAGGREALAAGEPARAATMLAEALALWRGPPLADFAYEAWVQAAIGRLEELRLSALEDRIEADLACGRHGELVGELESLISEQPLRERLRAQLMLALYRAGRQADALEAYQAARRTLVEELGIEPSSEVQSLNHAILNQDEALAAPPRAAAARGAIELPVPARPLVGREHELRELVELLRGEEIRLLTMTGAGGTGKTRLALEVAATLVDEYPDGVFFVSLAPIRDPALVVPTIAKTIGVSEQGGKPPAETLADELGAKKTLLLLDNFEQVVEAAPAVAELLARAPKLKVLVTSREPLQLGAEHEYQVPALAQGEAVDLFRARAANAEPLPAVAEICRRLDGLPLAIELAAARTKVLPPRMLLERIEQRLPLLTGKRRDVPARQQTLRATIAWSYDLLSSEEQQVFRRLSVFVGGCTLEAAEHVTGADLDTLQSLVEKNLLRFSAERYWMLETIREYAVERLDASEDADEIRMRHATYFLTVAEAKGARDAFEAHFDELGRERNNFRSALTTFGHASDSAAVLRLSASLARFWLRGGYLREGLARLQEALRDPSGVSPATTCDAHAFASYISSTLHDLDRAAFHAEAELALARREGGATEIASGLISLGSIATYRGDLEEAEQHLEAALKVARDAQDDRSAAAAVGNLTTVVLCQGNFERAAQLARVNVDLSRATGWNHGMVIGLVNLACARLSQGNVVDASEALREAAEVVMARQFPGDLASWLEVAGATLAANGSERVATKVLSAAAGIRDDLGVDPDPAEERFHDTVIQGLRHALSSEFEPAWAEGAALTKAEAIALALERLPALR
jgi:predicted ATPase/DNA-binding SARP family transcriptional activator